MKRRLAIVGVLIVLVTACGGGESGPLIPDAEVRAAAAELDAVGAADVAAAEARDPDAERALYADDVVIIDGDGGLSGVDDLVWVAEFTWAQNPGFGESHGGTWVGLRDGVVLIDQWGFEGFTVDSPLHEYRIIEVEDGVVTLWTAVYALETRPYFGAGGKDQEAAALLDRYVAAWNSGDPGAVSELYGSDSAREDLLFGRASGVEEIEDQAGAVFDAVPGFELQGPSSTLGIRAHERVGTGGVFSLTTGGDPECAVEVLIYIESPDGGLVSGERVYYDAGSLVDCGLAG